MDDWVDYCFKGDQSGYVYVALEKNGKFLQKFYKYPEEQDKIRSVAGNRKKGNVYFCPALFSKPSGKARDVIGSWVSWADIDHSGRFPDDVPQAGFIVSSGSPGRTHQYWRASVFQDPLTLVSRNYYLAKELRADPSGIDPCQLLRVPGTLNHKHSPPRGVDIGFLEDRTTDLPLATKEVAQQKSYTLLPLEEVLVAKQLPKTARKLFTEGSVDRSSGLMRLAFELAEHGFNSDQVYTLVHNADERWGKFSTRDDKELRLSEIVARAEIAPLDLSLPVEDAGAFRRLLSWRSVSSTQYEIKWVYEGLLREKGLITFVGFPGVGKSQLAVQLAACSALGIPFVGIPFQGREQKVCYASPEMDGSELFYILDHMGNALTDTQLDILDDRVDFLPIGYSLPLDTVEVQEEYESLIEERGYTGLIIDSLSASVSESMNDDKSVKRVIDWVDRTRQKYGCWILLLAHMRKPPVNSKAYTPSINDLYGAQIPAQRSNSAVAITQLPDKVLEFRYLKGRQKDISEPTYIRRTEHLWFVTTESPKPQTKEKALRPADRSHLAGQDFVLGFDID